jgi:hypothetical protein
MASYWLASQPIISASRALSVTGFLSGSGRAVNA